VVASFGSIPHAELVKSVGRRIVDRRVLHLIKMWLECPVEETDDRGRKTRTTEAKDTRRGIPQICSTYSHRATPRPHPTRLQLSVASGTAAKGGTRVRSRRRLRKAG
jgi:hypothetical protein